MADQEASTPTAPTESSESTENTETVENQELEAGSSGETGEESTEAKAEGKDSKAASKKEEKKATNKKKLKLKVDGKEFDEEVDLDDDEYLTRNLQLAKAAQKRMSEASQLQKEVEAFITELRKNPKKVLADPTLGVDLKKMVQEYIEEEIANSQKTPEQIEREKLEAELKAMKEEREREKEETRRRELERLQQQEYERYENLMIQALDKSSLPKKPYVVNKIADYLVIGLQKGLDLTPQDVLPLVEDEIRQDLKDMIGSAPDEVVEAFIGKDIFNRIRKKNIQKVKQAPQTLKSVKDTGAKEQQSQDNSSNDVKKKTIKELLGV